MQQISFSGILKHPDAVKELTKELLREKHDSHSYAFGDHIAEILEYWFPEGVGYEDIDSPDDMEGTAWEALTDAQKATRINKLAAWRSQMLNLLSIGRNIDFSQDLYDISDTTRRHPDTELLNPDEVAQGASPLYKENRMIYFNVINYVIHEAFLRMIAGGKGSFVDKIDLKLEALEWSQIRDLPNDVLSQLGKTMSEIKSFIENSAIHFTSGFTWFHDKTAEELAIIGDQMTFKPQEESEITATALVSQISFSNVYSVMEKQQKKAYEDRKKQEQEAEQQIAKADAEYRAKKQAEFKAFLQRMAAKQQAESQQQKNQQNKK